MRCFLALLVFRAAVALAEPKDGGYLTLAMAAAEGLASPVSVLYDPEADSYLVSNTGGDPTQKDNNGFITELSPEGKVLKAKLILGGTGGVTLHAPKGLALLGGLLYVADIDTVRVFDRQTGAPRGEVKVPGSTFVNDLSVGPDGRIYLSDTGMTPKSQRTGTDGVYVIEPGKKPRLKTLVKDRALECPTGLWATPDALYVVTFGAAELVTLDLKGRPKGPRTPLPKGQLGGVVMVGDELIISSLEGDALYRGKPGGEFQLLAAGLGGAAGVGYDSKRHRLLVPCRTASLVEAWALP